MIKVGDLVRASDVYRDFTGIVARITEATEPKGEHWNPRSVAWFVVRPIHKFRPSFTPKRWDNESFSEYEVRLCSEEEKLLEQNCEPDEFAFRPSAIFSNNE